MGVIAPQGPEGDRLLSALAGDPALVAYQAYKQPGDVVMAPPAGYDVLGWVLVSGETAEAAHESVSQFVRANGFSVDPERMT